MTHAFLTKNSSLILYKKILVFGLFNLSIINVSNKFLNIKILKNATLFVLIERLSRKINNFLLRWYVKINYVTLAFKQHEMEWIRYSVLLCRLISIRCDIEKRVYYLFYDTNCRWCWRVNIFSYLIHFLMYVCVQKKKKKGTDWLCKKKHEIWIVVADDTALKALPSTRFKGADDIQRHTRL